MTKRTKKQPLFQNEMDQELRELMGKQVSLKTWVCEVFTRISFAAPKELGERGQSEKIFLLSCETNDNM